MTEEHEDDHHHFQTDLPRYFFNATPILLVDDVNAAVDHYRDVLGFKVSFRYGEPPTYAAVYRNDVAVNFSKSEPPGRRNGMPAVGEGNGHDFYVGVKDIDELFEELKGKGAKIRMEPQTWPYGMREFAIEDLNGYRIIFGEGVGE